MRREPDWAGGHVPRSRRQRHGLAAAAKGSWVSDNVFEIVSRSVLEGVITRSTLTFSGRHVDIAVEANGGFRARLQGEADEWCQVRRLESGRDSTMQKTADWCPEEDSNLHSVATART
jgi:hypothetical protein